MMDYSNKVLLVGCGVAGPALAVFLRRKGYSPVIFDKLEQPGKHGGSVGISVNGIKVLDLVGVGDEIRKAPPLQEPSFYTSDGEVLVDGTAAATAYNQHFNEPTRACMRQNLHEILGHKLQSDDIPVYRGFRLVDIQQSDDKVTAVFDRGRKEEGIMLIGCDGMRSRTRDLMLQSQGIEPAPRRYFGVTLTYGFSPRPSYLVSPSNGVKVFYGVNATIVLFASSATHCVWVMYMPESEEKGPEAWRSWYTEEDLSPIKASLLSKFDTEDWRGAQFPELIRSTEWIIKIGQYERPRLPMEQWYHSRCVLVGDAAHTMTSAIAQGANQALEDCYHLANFLPQIPATTTTSSSDPPPSLSAADLTSSFHQYASLREPRTTDLTKTARQTTEGRAISDPEVCKRRNEFLRQSFKDPEVYFRRLVHINGPSF